MVIRALEFYSGIGGLHRALEASGIPAIVVRSFDWDQTACQVYAHNYGPNIVFKTDISTLSATDLIPLNASLWLLSPSCQPYTVLNPDAKGDKDPRAQSFLHLINNVVPSLAQDGHAPKWILVENVAGFETSLTREILVKTLQDNKYSLIELLLTPLQFGIPNSRLRYYILAKLRPLSFQNTEFGCDNRWTTFNSIWRHIPGKGQPYIDTRDEISDMFTPMNEIRLYLENDNYIGDHPYRISDRVLWKWGRLFDIVRPSSRRSCCFTRGYRQLVERSGSILQMNETLNTTEVFDTFLQVQAEHSGLESNEIASTLEILRPLRLRYFTPTELMALFCFISAPGLHAKETSSSNELIEEKTSVSSTDFRWPAYVSTKSKYRLIGNSVNVEVVKHLISYLFEGDNISMQL